MNSSAWCMHACMRRVRVCFLFAGCSWIAALVSGMADAQGLRGTLRAGRRIAGRRHRAARPPCIAFVSYGCWVCVAGIWCIFVCRVLGGGGVL